MPDYTVSGDVDSMLRSANDAGIRSAIGVGTTDAPAFAGLSTTGNAGIGTATPASGLHVAGLLGTNTVTYDSAAALKLTNTNGNSSWLLTSGVIGVLNGSFSIRQESNSQPAVVISGVGSNVGIGLNVPTAKLDISDTALSGSGSLAGSALNIAQTWNTTGTPSALKLNVTDTASNAASNLMDLQVGGVSRFFVNKDGLVFSPSNGGNGGGAVFGGGVVTNAALYTGQYGLRLASDIGVAWSATRNLNAQDTFIYRDDVGILAQRNGVNAQAFRVYNTSPVGGAKEWFEINWQPTGTNSVKIGTALAGGGQARPIDFVTGGVARMSIAGTGNVGIGTASPAAKLDVVGANGDIFLLKNSTQPVLSVFSAGGAGFISINHSNSPSIVINQSSGNKITLAVGSNNLLATNSGGSPTDLIIQGVGGNVGIGTTTPASKLTVTTGDVEVDTVTNGIILKAAGTSTRYRLTLNAGGTALVFTAV